MALDTPKTVLVDARNLSRKKAAPPEDWWWLRSFDLLRSTNVLGGEVSESVALDTPKTVLVDARNLTSQLICTVTSTLYWPQKTTPK